MFNSLDFRKGDGMRVGAVFGLWLLLAQVSDAAPLTPTTDAQQAPFGAIGQITYGGAPGGAICTGTLVAADLVLTAAHCVAPDGVPMRAGDVQFAAGWWAGKSLAIRYGDEIILAGVTTGQARALAQDMALIVLDVPIEADVVAPMPLADRGAFAGTYGIMGYRRDAPDALQGASGCPLLDVRLDVLRLGCGVVSGNSGAPVLGQQNRIWQLVAVTVAGAGHGDGAQAYAVMPSADLRKVIAAR